MELASARPPGGNVFGRMSFFVSGAGAGVAGRCTGAFESLAAAAGAILLCASSSFPSLSILTTTSLAAAHSTTFVGESSAQSTTLSMKSSTMLRQQGHFTHWTLS